VKFFLLRRVLFCSLLHLWSSSVPRDVVWVLGERLTINLRLASFVEGDREVLGFVWWKRTGFVAFGHSGELGFDFGGGGACHGDR